MIAPKSLLTLGIAAASLIGVLAVAGGAHAGTCPADQMRPDARTADMTMPKDVTDNEIGVVPLGQGAAHHQQAGQGAAGLKVPAARRHADDQQRRGKQLDRPDHVLGEDPAMGEEARDAERRGPLVQQAEDHLDLGMIGELVAQGIQEDRGHEGGEAVGDQAGQARHGGLSPGDAPGRAAWASKG